MGESMDIAEERGFRIMGYCEPFCGMLGVYRHIPSCLKKKGLKTLHYLAGDANGSVIAMWKAAQRGWRPPISCSEAVYNDLKNAEDSAMRGFVGHQCSFGGQFFNGFAKKYDLTKNPERASKRVTDIGDELSGVKFDKTHYDGFSGLKNFIIYCDPPYADTHCRYFDGERRIDFDTKTFWHWARMMAQDNIVFVSEYRAPEDIDVVWQSGRERLYLV